MLKVMLLMKRKPGLSLAEFIERYETHSRSARREARQRAAALRAALPSPESDGSLRQRGRRAGVRRPHGALVRGPGGVREDPQRPAAGIPSASPTSSRTRRSSSTGARAGSQSSKTASPISARAPRVSTSRATCDGCWTRTRSSISCTATPTASITSCTTRSPSSSPRTAWSTTDPASDPPSAAAARFARCSAPKSGFLATSHHNANVLVTFESDDRASRAHLGLRVAPDAEGRDAPDLGLLPRRRRAHRRRLAARRASAARRRTRAVGAEDAPADGRRGR